MGKDRKQGTEIFAKKLRELMERNNLTQQKLAESIDLSRQTVQKYLKGICFPEADILARIATQYGVSIDYLVLGIESKSELIWEYDDIYGTLLKDDIIRYITRPEESEFITLDGDYGRASTTESRAGMYSESLEKIADQIALEEIKKDLAELQKRYREKKRQEIEKWLSERKKEG